MGKAKGRFVDFRDLTGLQRIEARSLRPKWKGADFLRMSFWVKPDGKISRRAGHHQLVDFEARKIEGRMKRAWDQTPEMSRKWKSATFHFAPER
jgi:hypothetical protein